MTIIYRKKPSLTAHSNLMKFMKFTYLMKKVSLDPYPQSFKPAALYYLKGFNHFLQKSQIPGHFGLKSGNL